MRRGEVWTFRDDGYASKARPVVVLQTDLLEDEGGSVILALLTSVDNPAISSRVLVEATPENGLRATSHVMVEKLLTVRQRDLGSRIGSLTDEQMRHVSRKLAALLAITAEDLDT